MDLTIKTITDASVTRAHRWHDGDLHSWSSLEWAGAMCGEAGEAANAAKKLKRLQSHMVTINEESRHYNNIEDAKRAIGKECADTILYALLLMAEVEQDATSVLRDVFNQKSEEYGFPERL